MTAAWVLVFVACGISTCDLRVTPVTEEQCKAMVLSTRVGRGMQLFCIAPDGARWPEDKDWKRP